MSCDYAVWHYDRKLSEKEALQRYTTLCDDPASLPGESAAIDNFYKELTAKYPEIDSIPEDAVDSCPWSCALDKNGTSVVMPIVWSRAGEVGRFIADLAEKHGLVLYDPQSGRTFYPDSSEAKEPGFLSRIFGRKKK